MDSEGDCNERKVGETSGRQLMLNPIHNGNGDWVLFQGHRQPIGRILSRGSHLRKFVVILPAW